LLTLLSKRQMRLDVKQGPHYELEGCSHLHLLTEGKEFLDLGSRLRLQLQQMLVADRVALGDIGMHPGSVQTDCAQFQHTGLLGEQEHLNGEILQFGQKRAPG